MDYGTLVIIIVYLVLVTLVIRQQWPTWPSDNLTFVATRFFDDESYIGNRIFYEVRVT